MVTINMRARRQVTVDPNTDAAYNAVVYRPLRREGWDG